MKRFFALLLTLCMVLTLLPAALLTASATDTKTITVGVISYLINDPGADNWKVHYWGGADGAQDANCTATGTTVQKSVGNDYWGNDAQTFYVYTAEIPADATGFKVWHSSSNRWFGDDGDPSQYNQAFVFNYSGDKANYYYEAPAAVTWTVTFMNETAVYATETVNDGSTATAPANDPVKGGLVFLGWFEDNATTAFNFTTPITADLILYARWDDPTHTEGYYINGLGNKWDVASLTAANMFTRNTANTAHEEYMLFIKLTAGDKFKAVYVKNDGIEADQWYPGNMDNYTVDAEHAGYAVVYFRPNLDGEADWYGGCIYVAKPGFSGHSLSLNGDIGVNFYWDLPIPDGVSAKVKFSWGGNTQESTLTAKGTSYFATANVAAKEMTEEITAELYFDDELVATNKYSVAQYANEILNDTQLTITGNSAALQALAQAMLIYGAEAQVFFDYNTAAPAYDLSNVTFGDVPNAHTHNTFSNTALAEVGLSFYGTSLVLKTKTELNVYFKVKDAGLFNTTTVTLNGNPLTPKFTGTNDSYAIFTIENIAAQDVSSAGYTLTFVSGAKTVTVTVYPSVYLYLAANDATDTTNLPVLVKALNAYSAAAKAYFDSLS